MKRVFIAIALISGLVSCQKQTEQQQTDMTPPQNIAYVDSSKLLNEYQESKDIEAKYKAKSEQMGKELDAEFSKFKADVAFFEKNAQSKGMQWAQQTGAALQEREQRLSYTQQAMMQKLQAESGAEMDTLISQVKQIIREYGKEKKYSFILSTSDASNTVLYAQEGTDITQDLIKLLNEKYQAKKNKKDEELVDSKIEQTSK